MNKKVFTLLLIALSFFPLAGRADLGLIDAGANRTYAVYGTTNGSTVDFRSCAEFVTNPNRTCERTIVTLRMPFKTFDQYYTRSIRNSDEAYSRLNQAYQTHLERKDSLEIAIDREKTEIKSLQGRKAVLEELIRTIDRKLQNPNLPAADREKLLKQRNDSNAELALIPGRISANQERLRNDEAEIAAVIPLFERAKLDLAARSAELDAAKAELFAGLEEGKDQVFFSVEGTYSLLKKMFSLEMDSIPVATCQISGSGSSNGSYVNLKLSDGIYPVQAKLTVQFSWWNDYSHLYEYKSLASTITPGNGTFWAEKPEGNWGINGARLDYAGVSGGCSW